MFRRVGVTIAQLTQSPTVATPLTQQGSLIGTFLYMSPEQLEGREVDARCDIWAFGCVLYEMATGRHAFEGKTQASLVGAIMNSEPPPLSAAGSTASPALDALIRACLAKDPEERIQTAHDIKLQLSWIAQAGSQSGAAPVELPKRRRSVETAAWAVAALAVVAGALGWWRASRPPAFGTEPVRFTVPVPATLDNVDLPRISPDGRLIAFTGHSNDGRSMLWVRPLNALVANPLPGTEGTGRAFWSPDSRYLAYFQGGKLWKVPALGGPPEAICDAPRGADGSWSRKGVILFDGHTSVDPIRRVNASGGDATEAMPFDSTKGVGWPAFLPDDRHYLYVQIGPTGNTLMIGELGKTSGRPLGLAVGSRIEVSSDGHLLYVRDRTLLAQRFDTRAMKLTGEPFPVADSLPISSNAQANFSVSSNGVLLYRAVGSALVRLVWVDRTGRRVGEIAQPQLYRAPALSPDGRRLAVRRQDGAAAPDIWTIDLTRGISTRFTFDPGTDGNPVWSPDGSRIFWSATRGGVSGIWSKSASGLGQEQLVYPVQAWTTSVSPDGRHLIVEVAVQSRNLVLVKGLGADTTTRTLFDSPFAIGQTTFSPDGRRLAYCSYESGRAEVYVANFTGEPARWQISTDGGFDPVWSRDGRELDYITPDQKLMSVPIAPGAEFSPGMPVELFAVRGDPQVRNNYVISPDGQRFLCLVPESSQNWPMTVVLNWQARGGRR